MIGRPDFVLDCTVTNPSTRPSYNNYNSLKDNNLRGYFNEPRRSHLLNNNIVSFKSRSQTKVSSLKTKYSTKLNKSWNRRKTNAFCKIF